MLRIATLNAKGASKPEDFRKILHFLERSKIKLACVTESHITAELAHQWRQTMPECDGDVCQIVTNAQKRNQGGVTWILMRPNQFPQGRIAETFDDGLGRTLGIRWITQQGAGTAMKTVNLLGIYAPNQESEQVHYYNQLHTADLRVDMILGDFNATLKTLDRNPPGRSDDRVCEAIETLMRKRGLLDGWRLENDSKREFTFRMTTGRPRQKVSSRIDRIYITPSIFKRTLNWQIRHIEGELSTDHDLVWFEWEPGRVVEKGPGTFSIKATLIKDKAFRAAVKVNIKKLIDLIAPQWKMTQPNDEDREDVSFEPLSPDAAQRAVTVYDEFLLSITEIGQKLDEHNRIATAKHRRRLERSSKRYEAKRRTRKGREDFERARNSLRSFLRRQETRRSLLKEAKTTLGVEVGSKGFYDQRDSSPNDATIYGLRKENGNITRKPAKILHQAEKYYHDIFSSEPTNPHAQEDFLRPVVGGDFKGCDRSVRCAEIGNIIRGAETGTVPGADGIPYEFYKGFYKYSYKNVTLLDIITIVMTCLIERKEYGLDVPARWCAGIIKLLYKKGDRALVSNYRPITLTNTTYKIFSRTLNERLLPIFDKTIGKHQSSHLPKRSIFDNVKQAQALIDRAEQLGTPLYITLLDQEKAYDRVEHEWLWKVLKHHGTPDHIIDIIKGCYEHCTSQIMINGWITEPFAYKRGVRQGDPLAGLLYNISIDPLALAINLSPQLPGFKDSSGHIHKVRMFSDDTLVVLTELDQWKALRKLFEHYGRASGARLNKDKCEIVAAGIDVSPGCLIDGVRIIWRDPEGSRYLGVPIGTHLNLDAFWRKMETKMTDRIKSWARLDLAIRPKIVIAKSSLYGMLWYALRLLPISPEQLQPITRTINRFIWGKHGKTKIQPPISVAQACRPIEEGGLNALSLENMQNAYYIQWIAGLDAASDLRRSERPAWTTIVRDVMLHTADEEIRVKITRPWAQQWSRRSIVMPPSIEYFWKPWRQRLQRNIIPPTTREELAATDVWFHPSLYGIKHVGSSSTRWKFPVWDTIWKGGGGLYHIPRSPIDLWFASLDNSVDRNIQQATERLVKCYPYEWTNIFHHVAAVGKYEGRFQNIGIYSDVSLDHIDLQSSIHEIYTHLQRGTTRARSDDKDLLKRFKDVCARDRISITAYSDAVIWRSAYNAKLDNPKVGDLLWKVFSGRLCTGEDWQDEPNCLRCGVVQDAEHLFWGCPAAQKVWEGLRTIWHAMGHKDILHLPKNWGEFLLWATKVKIEHKRKPKLYRRWRILYGEAMMCIWNVRCEANQMDSAFPYTLILDRLEDQFRSRIQMDRQRALDSGDRREISMMDIRWCYDPVKSYEPRWLTKLNVDQLGH